MNIPFKISIPEGLSFEHTEKEEGSPSTGSGPQLNSFLHLKVFSKMTPAITAKLGTPIILLCLFDKLARKN